MTAHLVIIETTDRAGEKHVRWRCSCGRIGPGLILEGTISGYGRAMRRSRNGGARHVAATERRGRAGT